MRGVDPIDIKRRLGLGIAKLLRVRQHIGERLAGALHAGQDVIAGAVEDPRNTVDAIGCKPFTQCLDGRDAAGDGGLEHEPDIV